MRALAKIILLFAIMLILCFGPFVLHAGEHLININNATIEELKSLPYVGNVIAERIKKYRQEHPFKSKEEIIFVENYRCTE